MRGAYTAAAIAFLTAVVLASPTACDFESLSSDPPTSLCTESGVQCRLPTGPLGVCESSPCPPGVDPPCFKCTPQH
jgi:hypothetical protein